MILRAGPVAFGLPLNTKAKSVQTSGGYFPELEDHESQARCLAEPLRTSSSCSFVKTNIRFEYKTSDIIFLSISQEPLHDIEDRFCLFGGLPMQLHCLEHCFFTGNPGRTDHPFSTNAKWKSTKSQLFGSDGSPAIPCSHSRNHPPWRPPFSGISTHVPATHVSATKLSAATKTAFSTASHVPGHNRTHLSGPASSSGWSTAPSAADAATGHDLRVRRGLVFLRTICSRRHSNEYIL